MPQPSRHAIPHPAGGQTSLYLVRHGQTEGNVKGVLVGSTDLPLDELGIRQAELVAERLATSVEADEIVTSPLQRARVTAEIIGARMGRVPKVRPGLREWNFGAAEGHAPDALAAQHPEIAARFANVDDDDIGWPEGETRGEFHQRVYSEFVGLLRCYRSHRVIVVAHGGVFGSLLAQIHGTSPNDRRAYFIQNCSVTHLEVSVDDTTIHLLNDVEHLVPLMQPAGVRT